MRLKGEQLRLICCLEPKNGVGTWGFKEEEGNSQEDKKNRCLVLEKLKKKVIFENNSFPWAKPPT